MRVQILSSVAGPNWRARPGQKLDLPEAEAKSLIRAGVALSLEAEAPKPQAPAAEAATQPAAAAPEAATVEAAENAALTTERPKGRGRK
jgi:hypothetical protein